MEEALSGIILIFYRFVDWLFYSADIRPGLSVGFILMAAAITGTIIATIGPRVIGPKSNAFGRGFDQGYKNGKLQGAYEEAKRNGGA